MGWAWWRAGASCGGLLSGAYVQAAHGEETAGRLVRDDRVDDLVRGVGALRSPGQRDVERCARVRVAEVAHALVEHGPAQESASAAAEPAPGPVQRPVHDGEVGREVEQSDRVEVAARLDVLAHPERLVREAQRLPLVRVPTLLACAETDMLRPYLDAVGELLPHRAEHGR